MKTTAEEKLLRSLENIVEEAATKFSKRDFKKSMRETHNIAMDVIAKHQRMIGLWRMMDRRIQRRAKALLK